MFRVPFYTLDNYFSIINTRYDFLDKLDWVDIKDFLQLMDEDFIYKYSSRDARKLSENIVSIPRDQKVKFGNRNIFLREFIVAVKLLMPSLWTCKYFFWQIGTGSHTGLDLLLPRGTPIISFGEGVVTRVKRRDGVKKDEGNCVVIKIGNYFYSYKHLDTILVDVGQNVVFSTVIGTCGTTGMSTQYHLHFQVDNQNATFNPYWSNQISNVNKCTENPINFLKKSFGSSDVVFYDLPLGTYGDAILFLFNKGIVKGHNKQCFPLNIITRGDFAILINRICQKFDIYKTLHKLTDNVIYKDDKLFDVELKNAVIQISKYGIINGNNGFFEPNRNIMGEEVLAILGRLFFALKDSDIVWYEHYKLYFQVKKIIDQNWIFFGKSIDRKEVFLLLYKCLKIKFSN